LLRTCQSSAAGRPRVARAVALIGLSFVRGVLSLFAGLTAFLFR
jgi:hypothetical protein